MSVSTIRQQPATQLGIHPESGRRPRRRAVRRCVRRFPIGNNFEGEIPQVGNTFQWSDNLSKVRAVHTMKFGTDIRRQRFDQTLYFNVNGHYSYSAADPTTSATRMTCFPTTCWALPDTYIQGSAQTENVRSTIFALFAQDSWKLTSERDPQLRAALGTVHSSDGYQPSRSDLPSRTGDHDLSLPVRKSDPTRSRSNPLIAEFGNTDCSPSDRESVPTGLVVPGDKGVPAGLTTTYYKTFAPRIGLAWSPGSFRQDQHSRGLGHVLQPDRAVGAGAVQR